MAVKLGQPLMPWQRYVADVGCEIDAETGLPAYREVIVTIPRQSGKTTLYLSWQINRCVSRRWKHPQRSAFTAQTGKDARDKWIDELFPLIKSSPIKALVAPGHNDGLAINEGMGNESIRFRTGSIIRILSTSTSSGHSKTLHQAALDELWNDADSRREQGLRPAMITIQDAQLLVCSTAGTDDSVVLNRKVEQGRAATLEDTGHGVAYFEWSAPDDWDPDDWDSYFGFSPALCPDPPCRCAPAGEGWRHTITLAALRAERDGMELPEFKRAYGNRKTGAADLSWRVISRADFEALVDPHSQATGPLVFSADVTPERSFGTISAIGSRSDGDLHAEVVEHAPGTSWMVGRAVELDQKWRPAYWVIDPGAAKFLGPLLEEQGLKVECLTAGEVAQAYGIFRSAVSSAEQGSVGPLGDLGLPPAGDAQPITVPRIRLRPGQPEHWTALVRAVEGAVPRRLGDGTTWDRKTVETVISPIVSITNGVFGFVTRPPEAATVSGDLMAGED